MNTPRAAQLGSVDVIPNLLMTTLAVVTAALPPGKQLFQSAPPPKYNLSQDAQQHPLTLGINPQPQVQRLDASAPPPKYQVFVDQPLFHPLTLGINPQPQVKQWDSSAPRAAPPVQVDTYPNLLATTLKPAAAVPFTPPDTAQWQGKYQVQADNYPNVLVLGYPTLIPSFAYFEPAPPSIPRVELDTYPNLLSTTLKPVVAAPFTPVDTSQWQTKYQVEADPIPHPLTLGINPQPQTRQLDASAPPPKFAVQVDVYPNLAVTTLLPPPPPLNLPLGLPVDVAQFQPKYDVTSVWSDVYANTLILGYPPPPPVVAPPPPTGSVPGHTGGGKRKKKSGPYMREGQVFGEQYPPAIYVEPAAKAAKGLKSAGKSPQPSAADGDYAEVLRALMKELL